MSGLTDAQLAIFTSQFLIMAYMSEIGYTLTQSILWTVLGVLALFGAAFSLFKIIRRNWVNPA